MEKNLIDWLFMNIKSDYLKKVAFLYIKLSISYYKRQILMFGEVKPWILNKQVKNGNVALQR